jgi:pimeloyl-ACP methyl ester carboxylesterase
LNHPEVIIDFAHRSIHVEAVIGKQIAEAYYHSKPAKSYYLGCSTGGRQAMQTALMYPDDFDGFVAGAPAVNWNVLLGAFGLGAKFVDAPFARSTHGFITEDLWPIVSNEIMKQCDALDGLVDRIISVPNNCKFDPAPLLCTNGATSGCLNKAQLEALYKIYSPMYEPDGKFLFPRFDPGAEDNGAWANLYDGNIIIYTNVSSSSHYRCLI